MADRYDKQKVAEKLREHGRISRLNANPAVRQRFAALFQQHGWVAEPGLTEFETFVEYARNADAGNLAGERSHLFEKKMSREEIAHAIALRTNLGTPSEVRRALDEVKTIDLRDGLLERMSQKDHQHREGVDLKRERRDFDPIRSRDETRNVMGTMARRMEEREASAPTPAAPEPAPEPTAPRSISESLRAAYDKHTNKEPTE